MILPSLPHTLAHTFRARGHKRKLSSPRNGNGGDEGRRGEGKSQLQLVTTAEKGVGKNI